ncbi:MAG: hypothetical protein QNJ45_21420 [Ardenticatenaceae bacterium]|nr:hypothetical protein [Ardenticatenaceae bacterium]
MIIPRRRQSPPDRLLFRRVDLFFADRENESHCGQDRLLPLFVRVDDFLVFDFCEVDFFAEDRPLVFRLVCLEVFEDVPPRVVV